MKFFKAFTIIICIILGIVILPWVINPIVNDIQLYLYSHKLASYILPSNTEVIEKESICGKLNGNGGGMDFLATMLIRSDLSQQELQQHYSFATVVKQEGIGFNDECLEHGEIKYSKLENVNDFEKYFVVYIYDGGHLALFDIRGG